MEYWNVLVIGVMTSIFLILLKSNKGLNERDERGIIDVTSVQLIDGKTVKSTKYKDGNESINRILLNSK